jgi:hypothetical protein
MRDVLRALEGSGLRRWYVAEQKRGNVSILAGPFPTRKRGKAEVAKIARERGEVNPWPRIESFDGYPGFCAVHTEATVFYVGRASAMHDQGSAWADAISAYERASSAC